MPSHISGEQVYYYTLDGTDPVPGEAGTVATASLTPFMPPPDNPSNTLKVLVSYSVGTDSYIDSEIKTVTYQREAAPVSWTMNEIAGSAFDRMAAELELSSQITDQGVAGADISYRFLFQGEGEWLVYDDTRRPWLLPGEGPVVGLRSSAPGFLDWTEDSAFGPNYYEGLVYLTNTGEVYLYQPDSTSDDILLEGFDSTPVEIATYGGSLYYIDSDGLQIRRWDPSGADPEFGGIDQNPAPGDGSISYISTDNNGTPDVPFYYMTHEPGGDPPYRLWKRDVDAGDGDDVDDEISATGNFTAGFNNLTTGLYLPSGQPNEWIHVNGGTLDVGGSTAYGSITEPDDWVDGTREPVDVLSYDGALHYIAEGSLYRLVDGAGNDDALPNVDQDGDIVSVDGL
ncbi:MAG: hypothetical protein ACOCYG_00860 [Spirochaetota bacterium]